MAVLYPVHRGLGTNPQPGSPVPAQPDEKAAEHRARSRRSPIPWTIWLGAGFVVPPPEIFRLPPHPAETGPSLLSRLTTGGQSRAAAQHRSPTSETDVAVLDDDGSDLSSTGGLLVQAGAYLRGDKWLPQLIRFALVGGLSNIGYFLLFMACYGGGPQLANLTGSVVSTALANEMHRRLTFHAADRVGWLTAQLEGGGLALAGLAITSASLAVLDFLAPGMDDVVEALAVIGITAAVGALRFITLRLWVF